MTKQVNLNADLGESYGMYSIGNDEAMLATVNSANIACGYHAGDPLVMRETIARAKQNGVSIGAHPSFPDHQGFGRRQMHLSSDELEAMVAYQIGAIMAMAAMNDTVVTHVKPHGALNNMASVDQDMSDAIARAIKAVDSNLILLATAGSCLFKGGINAGLPTAGEIFADRTYDENGNLAPRSQPGSMIHDANQAADQILSFLDSGKILTPEGKGIEAEIHSICVHGDSDGAINIANGVKERLTKEGYRLATLPEIFS
ncbi:5-oxoprolinase subunit PxpA [Sneathiella sp. P13V-1]|uniref:LamB/YcsF family protein n=1 Tax=Sneathiella sp. P13V-1 TaxID=2697366 RepID=UPI00187B250A|nr:5-oxoprolinase subunit PxpA [Sneathiella sp. P13V-1]MBE7637198.1 5-oxoprolinase subunit PxpA [Sneathiella sp. P13V-1]